MQHFLLVKNLLTFCALIAAALATSTFACDTPAAICQQKTEGAFELIKSGRPTAVILDTQADPAVQRVIHDFADDLARVSGKKARLLTNSKTISQPSVIIGVLGESKLIDQLVSAGKLAAADLAGQWEAYRIAVVENPWPKVERALVIVGSDRRGAIYGAYDVSEKMGVSPWYWFADAPVPQSPEVYITAGNRSDQPKVRYRGIFINDEDPAFSGWAKKQFGGVNADMYAHVFELMLRMKANYLWPAMWGKQFHVDDPRNTRIADAMGIVVGSSHHEPMTRAHAEWHKSPDDKSAGGAWNYETNSENLRKFWRGGIERMMSKGNGQAYESLVTVGMRGDGDEPMSEGTAIQLLETIVADQRRIIAEVTGKPAAETPQVWALYKEVQDYYDKGMTVPEDITLLFADDNWGQIRRLPTRDLSRKGGYGVYYHFDYVGVPRNYKWLNTTQIAKVWQQMDLAYARGARNLWVVNVGDIKPMELPLDFFLKMAWNPEAMTPEKLDVFPQQWATQQFGAAIAPQIAGLLTRYSQYAAMRKPELLNENSFNIGDATPTVLQRGEFDQHIAKWRNLVAEMEKVKAHITPAQESAFFQLVEYPIAALANLYELYFATAWNRRLASHHDARANYFLQQVEQTFAKDAALTLQYHQLNKGKWDGIMNQVHMNYVHWNEPTQQTMPPVTRVADGKNNVPVKFVDQPAADTNTIELEASAFNRAFKGAQVEWKAIRHLAQSHAAMVSFPQGQKSTRIEDGVRMEYDFTNTASGALEVTLVLNPTLDTLDQGGIKVGVSLDDEPVSILTLNLIPTGGAITQVEQRDWSNAVINHQHPLTTRFEKVTAGKHQLKVWRIDDNILLEKILIKPVQ